ncbi:EAL domain-containing protein [Enterovibrio calviensis]|uniref:bifunctional diguanylate cyclase/phosphodiesterase n=1 Tax=Enterovibrio calviensis TaxID=91359 RepID=UPI003736C807
MKNIFSKKLHWIICAIGTVIAICSGISVNYLEAEKRQSTFNTLIEQKLKVLEKAFFSFNELQLTAQLYFQSSESLDKEKFQQFLASSTREGSGIHSVFWLPKVAKVSSSQFEDQVINTEGQSYVGYKLFPQTTDNCSWSLNDFTFPVLYVSPQNQAENYIGWRAESTCQFAYAMERAFFQRRPEASFFVQDTGSGVRLFSAVMNNEKLRGYLVTSIYFDSFFAAIWPDYKTLDNLHISVMPQFSAKGDASSLLFSSGDESTSSPDLHTETVRHLVKIPGSEEGLWIAFAHTNQNFMGYRYSIIMTVLGILLTFATSVCVWSYSSRLELANRLVKEQTKKLRFQAYHDNLTSLNNRLSLEKRLKQEQLQLQLGESDGFSILFIDLDRFKQVNDSLGHLIGDKLLQAVAERIYFATPEKHRSFRFGGDEFVVCLSGIVDQESARRFANTYRDALDQPYMIDGHNIQVGASIGISRITEYRFTLLDIIQQADIAMYHAKASGEAITFYNEKMLKRIQTRFNIEQELSYAIDNKQFSLVFQPICRGENVAHFEALLRWNHPTLGNISPMDFISIAEDTNQIHALGRWVLNNVCGLLAQWKKIAENDHFPGITVNVSPKQLNDPTFIGFVKTLLETHAIPHQKLGIEITESILMEDGKTTAASLSELKNIGIRLYLDDFGTGYSSLAVLQQYAFDVLKIDRHFITSIHGEEDKSSTLCAAIIQLSRVLGLEVVAEGVETDEQLTWLNAQGCEYIQGYIKSKPLPVETLSAWHPACQAIEPSSLKISRPTHPRLTSLNPANNQV